MGNEDFVVGIYSEVLENGYYVMIAVFQVMIYKIGENLDFLS